jgi:ABC-type phosphate transport system substrate-binding protein
VRCCILSLHNFRNGIEMGLANVEAGSVDIGDSDIPAASNQSDLVDHQVAVVIFGVIVNKDVTVTNITTAQLKQIYKRPICLPMRLPHTMQ